MVTKTRSQPPESRKQTLTRTQSHAVGRVVSQAPAPLPAELIAPSDPATERKKDSLRATVSTETPEYRQYNDRLAMYRRKVEEVEAGARGVNQDSGAPAQQLRPPVHDKLRQAHSDPPPFHSDMTRDHRQLAKKLSDEGTSSKSERNLVSQTVQSDSRSLHRTLHRQLTLEGADDPRIKPHLTAAHPALQMSHSTGHMSAATGNQGPRWRFGEPTQPEKPRMTLPSQHIPLGRMGSAPVPQVGENTRTDSSPHRMTRQNSTSDPQINLLQENGPTAGPTWRFHMDPTPSQTLGHTGGHTNLPTYPNIDPRVRVLQDMAQIESQSPLGSPVLSRPNSPHLPLSPHLVNQGRFPGGFQAPNIPPPGAYPIRPAAIFGAPHSYFASSGGSSGSPVNSPSAFSKTSHSGNPPAPWNPNLVSTVPAGVHVGSGNPELAAYGATIPTPNRSGGYPPPPNREASLQKGPLHPTDPRFHLYFHLCGLFPDSHVQEVMAQHPQETNAKVLCRYLIEMSGNT